MIKTTWRFTGIVLAGCLVIAGRTPGSEPAAAKRLPIPAAESVAASRALIRDAYESDYSAAKQSGEPAGLVDKFRGFAVKESDPVKKYAFLLEAEDVATQHDDAAAALAIVDRLAEAFEIDGLNERAQALARLAGPRIAADTGLYEQAMATATKAEASERFEIATDTALLAMNVARAIDRAQKAEARKQQRKPAANEATPAANGLSWFKAAQKLHAQIIDHKKAFEAFKESGLVLATNPDDCDANLAAGIYLCLVAHKWDEGLPHLKKSDHATLGVLATQELALGDLASADAEKVFPLAGKWWEAAEAKPLSEDERLAIQKHAARLYAAVRPRLKDPLEIRIANTRGDRNTRRIWLNTGADNVFIYDPTKKVWREGNHSEGLVFWFNEVVSTPEYVEIFNESRGIRMRLYDHKVTIALDQHGSWGDMKPHGKWISPEEYKALGFPDVPQ